MKSLPSLTRSMRLSKIGVFYSEPGFLVKFPFFEFFYHPRMRGDLYAQDQLHVCKPSVTLCQSSKQPTRSAVVTFGPQIMAILVILFLVLFGLRTWKIIIFFVVDIIWTYRVLFAFPTVVLTDADRCHANGARLWVETLSRGFRSGSTASGGV